MTAQVPDALINEHPRVSFDGLYLYGIIRGTPSDYGVFWGGEFQYPTPPSLPGVFSSFTACWRGYVAIHRLAADGTFHIVEYHVNRYEKNDQGEYEAWQEVQTVNEPIEGDFWLVLRPDFDGDVTYLPFRDGRIVEDQSEWIQFSRPKTAEEIAQDVEDVRARVERDRGLLQDSNVKNLLHDKAIRAPRMHDERWWVVYSLQPIVCYDPKANEYACLYDDGRIDVFGELGKVVAKISELHF